MEKKRGGEGDQWVTQKGGAAPCQALSLGENCRLQDRRGIRRPEERMQEVRTYPAPDRDYS